MQTDKDHENFKKLIGYMKESKNGKTVGIFQKDTLAGDFYTAWKAALDEKKFENVDVGVAIAYVTAAKEENEILTVKKACLASVEIFDKYLRESVMDIVDAEKVRSIYLPKTFLKLYQLSSDRFRFCSKSNTANCRRVSKMH